MRELEAIEDLGTELLKFVVLNYTGFEKILKKNFKATKSTDMKDKWVPLVNESYFFTSTAIDDMLLHLHALRKVPICQRFLLMICILILSNIDRYAQHLRFECLASESGVD